MPGRPEESRSLLTAPAEGMAEARVTRHTLLNWGLAASPRVGSFSGIVGVYPSRVRGGVPMDGISRAKSPGEALSEATVP